MYKKKTIEHVAIIMDGNGRWATNKGLKRSGGHKAGIKNCIHIITNLDNQDKNEVFGVLTLPEKIEEGEKVPLVIGVAGSKDWASHHLEYIGPAT